MKMGNLNEEAWMNAAEARLIGALIGLARATDGNEIPSGRRRQDG